MMVVLVMLVVIESLFKLQVSLWCTPQLVVVVAVMVESLRESQKMSCFSQYQFAWWCWWRVRWMCLDSGEMSGGAATGTADGGVGGGRGREDSSGERNRRLFIFIPHIRTAHLQQRAVYPH
jgi:hypothetical protein